MATLNSALQLNQSTKTELDHLVNQVAERVSQGSQLPGRSSRAHQLASWTAR